MEKRHPLHLSSMELNYTAKGATVEISCRLFTDDLENALTKAFKVHADLTSVAKHAVMDELVKKYAVQHLQLKTRGKVIGLNYLGFEKDNEATVLYIESVPVKGLKDLEILNTFMYDLFDDQSNIMHITYNGNRKSTKLDYPDKLYKVVF
ncbi:DUF6702 family protein [Pedobacter sp.]|uniref:DUF6702 family protein n=1 Tax=Pedobacter sp. TaxID=1411316 RepID=UPI002D0CB7AC|nr:DUF6702 family protein [Pedobacter sp.]HWW37960.1 DUF6702 family protein [Pedobacter sp.]